MEVYKDKNGKPRYRERVILDNGHRISKSFERKADAVLWKQRIEYEKQRGSALGYLIKKEVPFGAVTQEWFDQKIVPIKPLKTTQTYASEVNGHLLPIIAQKAIGQINTQDADLVIRTMKHKELSNRTINKVLIRFKQIMNYAIEAQYVARSPLAGFKELKEPPPRDVYLSKSEILQLLRSNALENVYPTIFLALNTGLRLGELAGLCWDRVNFETGQIEVSRTSSRAGLQNTTKTNLKRYVPMNPETKKLLWDLLRKQRHPQFVLTTRKGLPVDINHISQRDYKRALKRAGLPLTFRFHDLRHTYASHFMMNGGNIYDLQKILGHTKIEMTMRYAHLSPDHLAKAANIVRFGLEEEGWNAPTENIFSLTLAEGSQK